MTPNEALETGAFPGDFKAADLVVPGGATDPMWYLIADHIAASQHQGSTWRRGFVEGFVAACEAIRGIDGLPGVESVLKDSVGLIA